MRVSGQPIEAGQAPKCQLNNSSVSVRTNALTILMNDSFPLGLPWVASETTGSNSSNVAQNVQTIYNNKRGH